MTLKHVLKLFSKTEVQEDKTHPCHLSQTILNRLFGRVLEREGVNVSCAKHTEKNLSSNRLNVLTTSKKAAFTLAEVLITLGIIGVVAALTLPTLIANHKKQTYVNQLKKVVNTLENAAQMAVADEGVSSFKDTSLYCKVMNPYDCVFRSSSSESWQTHQEFMSNNYLDLSKQYLERYFKILEVHKDSSNPLLIVLTLSDGSVINLYYYGWIHIDINGRSGPNTEGRDQFSLMFDEKGKLKSSHGNYYEKIVSDGWKMNY